MLHGYYQAVEAFDPMECMALRKYGVDDREVFLEVLQVHNWNYIHYPETGEIYCEEWARVYIPDFISSRPEVIDLTGDSEDEFANCSYYDYPADRLITI